MGGWHVGTSGWQYADWRGPFYPEKLPQRQWLHEYAKTFTSVEVNNAFYRLPERDRFAAWADDLPTGFVMAVKGSRFLTHIKRLKDPQEPVARLVDHASGLSAKLGPILLQLPPRFHVAPDRLDETLAAFPRSIKVAVELRDPSWHTHDVQTVLERHAAALVWADRDGRLESPDWVTADWGYVRLHHGPSRWEYGLRALKNRAGRWRDSWPGGYVYANNDPGAAAVRDALRLSELLDQ